MRGNNNGSNNSNKLLTTPMRKNPEKRLRDNRRDRLRKEVKTPHTHQQYRYSHSIHTSGSLFRETTALIDDRSISPHDTHITTAVNINLHLYSNQQVILQCVYLHACTAHTFN